MKSTFAHFPKKSVFSMSVAMSLILGCFAAFAVDTKAGSTDLLPTEPPVYEKYLGRSSYIPVVTQKLAHPKLVYADLAPAKTTRLDTRSLLDKWGWAVRTVNEPQTAYLPATRIQSASFYGGNGMNGNIGDGRTSVDGDENFKGIGPTGMVNPYTEEGHNSGTLKIDHAILEAVWSKLLDLELPFGANRVRGILGTGTVEDRDGYPGLRVLIVRDDFLRPAHFITNETSSKVGRSGLDSARVSQAILNLPQALPMPADFKSLDPRARLNAGLKEFIDRLAIQTAYTWSHSMYHGAMSPSNVTLQGAAADFGTFQALGGYPSVQLLSDCAPNGDFSEEIQVLKEFHESLIGHSNPNWKLAIGSFESWTARFRQTYQSQVEKEMLILSGAFPELVDSLQKSAETHQLADSLLAVAKAGNEQVTQTWVSPLKFETGSYNLPRILEKLASSPLSVISLEKALHLEISDTRLRWQLAQSYQRYFKRMNEASASVGITASAAQIYRLEAVKIRNRKMTELFRTPELQKQLDLLVQNYTRDADESKIRSFIEQKVNLSRRNFKDAAPYTVVLSQSLDEKTGKIVREIFDASNNRFSQVVMTEVTPLEKMLRTKSRFAPGALRCSRVHSF